MQFNKYIIHEKNILNTYLKEKEGIKPLDNNYEKYVKNNGKLNI